MSSEIRDINLAESGEQKIEWVRRNCDLPVSYTHLDVYKRQVPAFAGKFAVLNGGIYSTAGFAFMLAV